jgi:hypothetical protein
MLKLKPLISFFAAAITIILIIFFVNYCKNNHKEVKQETKQDSLKRDSLEMDASIDLLNYTNLILN